MIEMVSRMRRKNEHKLSCSSDNGSRGQEADLFREGVAVCQPHSQGRLNLMMQKGHNKVE
jgi:hypothetical protein